MLFDLFSRIKNVSARRLVIILIACLFLLFLSINLLHNGKSGQKHPEGFTGGEYKPEHFVYVSGSRGWNQSVNVGKYSVTLGSMLTASNQRLIVHLVKSQLLETIKDEEWKKEGIEVVIENIKTTESKYMANDILEFNIVASSVSKKYLIRIDFSHNPDKITIYPI